MRIIIYNLTHDVSMKKILRKFIKFLISKLKKIHYNDLLIVIIFSILFIGIGYCLTIANPIILLSIKAISDICTLLILGFMFGFSILEKNIKNKKLVTCSITSMFIMYILYDVYHVTTIYHISATGFNLATILILMALYMNSKLK